MNLVGLKQWIVELQGIDQVPKVYLTVDDGVYKRVDKKILKNLSTKAIIKLGSQALKLLEEVNLEYSEKAKLYKDLACGVRDYRNRLSDKKIFCELIERCLGISGKLDKKLSEQYDLAISRSEGYLALYTGFIRKHGRIAYLDNVSSKSLVLDIVQSLQQDPLVKQLLTAWHTNETQRGDPKNGSLVDFLATAVDRGTCCGQSMKVLELLDDSNRGEITEEMLHQHMTLKDCVRYQIFHILDVFLMNNTSAYVHGVSTKLAKEKLDQNFPCHKKKGVSSEVMQFANFEKNVLMSRLSDFIKNDIRENQSVNQQKDYAICVVFRGKVYAHRAIIYHSEVQKRYFWYDPYSEKDGLFSAESYKIFIQGVTDKIFRYKNGTDFTQMKFVGYRL